MNRPTSMEVRMYSYAFSSVFILLFILTAAISSASDSALLLNRSALGIVDLAEGTYLPEQGADNPDLIVGPCQNFNVVLVLDESGSISSEDENLVREATLSLAESLQAGGGQLALVEFSTNSSIIDIDGSGEVGYRTVDADFVSDLNEYLFPGGLNPPLNGTSGYEASGSTNWEDAFDDVIFLNNILVADLVIFMTDGNPNAYIIDTTGETCSNCDPSVALAQAIPKADLIKQAGSHMFGLAVGAEVNLDNISDVTGPDQDIVPGDADGLLPTTADYAAIPFSDLEACFNNIIAESCSPVIELEKSVYIGHDNGQSSPGAESVSGFSGTAITYCFNLVNEGDTHLELVSFSDPQLGINESDLLLLSGSWPLAPNESLTYFFETIITGDLINTASLIANPVDDQGFDLGLANVLDSDTAAVVELVDPCITCSESDSISPFFNYCSENIEVLSSSGNCSSTVAWVEPGIEDISDNCTPTCSLTLEGPFISFDGDNDLEDIDPEVQVIQDGTNALGEFGVGTRYVKYKATDGAGNTSFCIFGVTVRDNNTPLLEIGEDYQVECNQSTPPSFIPGYGPRVEYNRSYYFLSDDTLTWEQAASAANSIGGELTTISNAAENDFIYNSLANGEGEYWIGYNDYSTEGEFLWENGEPTTYTNWDIGEPNNLVNEDGVVIWNGGVWNDQMNDFSRRYVVEFNPHPYEATVSDLCSSVSITVSETFVEGSCANTGSLNREYVALDESGNSSTATQVITISDTTPPVVELNDTLASIYCDEFVCDYDEVLDYIAGTLTQSERQELRQCVVGQFNDLGLTPAGVSDNCEDGISWNEIDVQVDLLSSCDDEVTARLTCFFQAVDACGNVSDVVSTMLNLIDTMPPAIICPPDITVACGESTASSNTGKASANDDCGFITINHYDDSQPYCGGETEIITRTWVTTDACGNSITCEQIITVTDETPPILSSYPQDITVDCSQIPPAEPITATDSCSIASVELTEETTDGCPYTITRAYTATDECGNTDSHTQTITVVDTTAPFLVNVPNNAIAQCGIDLDQLNDQFNLQISEAGSSNGLYQALNGDFGPSVDSVSVSAEIVLVNDGDSIITDGCQPLVNDLTGKIALIDRGDCLFVHKVNNAEAAGAVGVIVSNNLPGGDLVIMVPPTDGTPFDPISIPSLFISYEDGQVLKTALQNGIVTASLAPASPVTAEDDCGEVDITYTQSEESGDCPITSTVTRIWTAIDVCGNTSIATQIVTFEDTTPPATVVPADTTIECTEHIPFSLAKHTDNCTPDSLLTIEFDYEYVPSANYCGDTLIRTWTVTDLCGNVSSTSQKIFLSDLTPPSIYCPADITIECHDSTLPAFTGKAFGEDDCSAISINHSDEVTTLQCPEEKDILRTWVVRDACGNSISCVQNIMVRDSSIPELTIAPDETVECGTSYDLVSYEVFDSCSDVEVVIDSLFNDFDQSYTSTDCSVPDAVICDNFEDYGPGAVVDQADHWVPWPGTPDVSSISSEQSNSGLQSLKVDAGGIEDNLLLLGNRIDGQWTVKWNVFIPSGNSSYFNIQDVEEAFSWNLQVYFNSSSSSPGIGEIFETGTTFIYPEDTWFEVECDVDMDNDNLMFKVNGTVVDSAYHYPGRLGAINFFSIDEDGAYYIDDILFEGESSNNLGCGNTGNWVITYTATDDCGNSAIETQNITLIDTTSPVLSNCPEDIVVECDAIPAQAVITAYDDCAGEVEVTFSEEIVDGANCPLEMTLIRVWTAEDGCGNISECTQIITVMDTTSPELQNAPVDVTVECVDDIPPMADLFATDNCDDNVEVLPASSTSAGTQCPVVQVITRSWTAYDDCGNTSTVSQTITVLDNTAPEFVEGTIPESITVECDNIPAPASPSATDNCSGDVPIAYEEDEIPGQCDGEKTIVRTWIANDECGNTAIATQIINVIDTSSPIFDELPQDESYECGEDIPEAPELAVSDNCSENVTVILEEEISGNTYPFLDCDMNTGEAFSGGEDWSIYLTVNGVNQYFVLDANGAQFTETAVGNGMFEAIITGTVVNPDNTDESWYMNVTLINKRDYNEWTGELTVSNPMVPRQPKIIAGFENPGDEFGWDYWEIDATRSQLIGEGDYTGDVLTLSHAPANYLFGFQVGENANGYAPGFGAGGWASYVGTIDGQSTSGQTSLAFQLDCPPLEYTITRTWTATDDCGNETMISQVLSVNEDSSPPEIVANPDATVECGEDFDLAGYDVSDGCGEVTVSIDSIFVSNCGNTGVWTITYHAIDASGNSAVASQTITIVDTTPPEFIDPPANGTAECDDIPSFDIIEAYDNCGDVDIDYSENLFSGACAGVLERTWTIYDECGNSRTHVHYLDLVDNTPPILVGVPDDLTIECDEDVPDFNVTASDNCDDEVEIVVTTEEVPGCSDATYMITYTFTATDDCENMTTAAYTLTVVDTTPPLLAVADDATVECGESFDLAVYEAADNCGGYEVVIDSVFTADCGNSGNWVFTYTVIDDCGNFTVETQTITVVDTSHPYFLGVPEDTLAECDGIDRSDDVNAYDECHGEIPFDYEEYVSDIACSGQYTLTRTWTATDDCGNSAVAIQTVTVLDTTAPEFDFTLTDIAVECDEAPIPVEQLTATDNCDNSPVLTMEEVRLEGDCEYNYELHRIYTATDDCGNTNTIIQVIYVEDTTAPEFYGLEPFLSVECDDIPEPSIEVAVDNCGNVVVTVEDSGFGGGCQGAIQRVYTATDNCGNSSTYTQIISVIDETAPVLDGVPDDITLECDQEVPGFNVTATDNCDEDVEVVVSSVTTLGCSESTYSITYEFTATDDCDNIVVDSYTLTVVDSTAPELEVAGDETVECDEPFDLVFYEAYDNCSDVEVVIVSLFIGDCGNTGNWVITYTATDECGNSTVATQNITVVDTTLPVIECPEDITIECTESTDPTNTGMVIANDNCSEVNISYVDGPFIGDCPVQFSRIWQAIDECGNQTECEQIIFMDDTTPPVITCPSDLTLPCNSPPPVVDLTGVTAADGCSGLIIQHVGDSFGGDFCTAVITRTFMATDDCGNFSSCEQIITIPIDFESPVIFAAENETIECGDPLPEPSAFVSDGCGEVTWSVVESFDSTCDGTGVYTRIYTAEDECGNTASDTQLITIVDTQPTVFICPDDIETCSDTEPSFTGTPEVSSTCSEFTISYDDQLIIEDPGNIQTIERTWILTEECGNQLACTQSIFIIVCPSDDCEIYQSPPVDLNKSYDDVNGVQDRVQLKWYKDSPEVKYTDEDAAACDIKYWEKRDLSPFTGLPTGPVITDPDTLLLVDRKKAYPDGSPRSIFKWPVKHYVEGENNTNRVLPNKRYEWQVRCACEHGAGIESPWSAVKVFNTPNFDTATGIYIRNLGFVEDSDLDKISELDSDMFFDLYPNPTNDYVNVVTDESVFKIELMDLNGSILLSEFINKNRMVLDLDNFSAGMYFIRITSDGRTKTKPIVVTN